MTKRSHYLQVLTIGHAIYGVVGCSVFWLSVLAGGVVGGVAVVRVHAVAPDNDPQTQPRSAIYLNDNLEAGDMIRRARKLAAQGDWTSAANLLQKAAMDHGDALIRLDSGEYVGIRGFVQRLISGWPKDGIGVYRELFEDQARQAFDRLADTHDVSALLKVFDRFFCTQVAGERGDRIGQLAIESGDLALAKRVYRRLMSQHPDRISLSHRLRATSYVVNMALGEAVHSEALDALKIRWEGEDRRVREVISSWSQQMLATHQQSNATDWPTFGGAFERSSTQSCPVDELGLLWRFDRFFLGDQEKSEEAAHPEEQGGAALGHGLSMFPVRSGDLLFVQQGRQVLAIHDRTGVVSWRFRFADEPAVVAEDLDDVPAPWNSVTVSQGLVFASLANDQMSYYAYQTPTAPSELLCLKSDTGKLVWQVTGSSLAHAFAELSFDSSPVVVGDRVMVVGRRRRSFGFEDAYLFAFRVSDGVELFRTHLGGASVGTFGTRRPTAAIIASHGDSVFVCTNLGSVASVSLYTGEVRWLIRYHPLVDRAEKNDEEESRILSTSYNPILWYANRIYVKPLDAKAVLVLRVETGSLDYTIPLPDDATVQLLGVSGDRLFVVGKKIAAYSVDEGTMAWLAALPQEARIVGRAALASQRLYVPTAEGLSMFAVGDGRREDLAWPAEQEPGNLLALGDRLIVAGASTFSVYVRKAALWEDLRQRMAEAASDPIPALEFAEVALRGGDFSEGLALFYQAIARAGDLSDPIAEELSRRIFADADAFADALSRYGATSADTLDKLLLYASQCAYDESSNVVYRIAFAERFVRADQPAVAVRLYHQLLRDRSLRDREVPDRLQSATATATATAKAKATSPLTVCTLARLRIAELLEQNSRSIYEPFDAEAKTWLKAGTQGKDEALLERLLQVFPNSLAAPQALITLGNMAMEQPGGAERSARFLTRAYYRYPREVDRAALIRRIADAYEQAGRPTLAYRWLSKGAVEFPDALLDIAGRRLSFRQYRHRLDYVRALMEPARPTLTPPLSVGFTLKLDPAARLMVPWYRHDPACDWSRFYVGSDANVQAYSTEGKAIWPKPLALHAPAELILAAKKVAIFATRTSVFAVDTVTGQVVWSHGKSWSPDAQPHDWEKVNGFRSHSLGGERLLSVRNDGTMTLVHWPTGEMLWSRRHQPVPSDLVRLDDREIVYTVPREAGALICRLDARNGDWLGTIQTQERRAIDDAFVSFDEQLVLVSSQSISSYNMETARLRWRTEFTGHLQLSSLYEGLDAIYLTEDGRTVQKVGLEDGRTMWESDAVGPRVAHDLTVNGRGTDIIVSSEAGVLVLDDVSGTTLWRHPAKNRTHYVTRIITRNFVLAISFLDNSTGEPSTAHFYDLRNMGSSSPDQGGTLVLGHLEQLKSMLALDGALLIQTDSTIQSWTVKRR